MKKFFMLGLLLFIFIISGCLSIFNNSKPDQEAMQIPKSPTPTPIVNNTYHKDCVRTNTPIPGPVGEAQPNLPFVGRATSNSCLITLYVLGRGAAPSNYDVSETQRYLLAERAAIADGYRLFSEKLVGVFVDAYTRAGYYAIDYDRIHLATSSFLKGVEILHINHKKNGVCEAEMKITITREQICCYFPQVVVNRIDTCNYNRL